MNSYAPRNRYSPRCRLQNFQHFQSTTYLEWKARGTFQIKNQQRYQKDYLKEKYLILAMSILYSCILTSLLIHFDTLLSSQEYFFLSLNLKFKIGAKFGKLAVFGCRKSFFAPNYTLIQNGKYQAIIVFDDRMLRYMITAYQWTSQTSRISEKLEKANEGPKGQIKDQTLLKIKF